MAKTTKKSSAKRRVKNPLKPKMDKQVAHEKEVSKAVGKRPSADVPNFNGMSDEEKRKTLFNRFPGDAMGIVVGKPGKNDPYNAMLPVDNT